MNYSVHSRWLFNLIKNYLHNVNYIELGLELNPGGSVSK